jgi:hypothetical protein
VVAAMATMTVIQGCCRLLLPSAAAERDVAWLHENVVRHHHHRCYYLLLL